MTREEIKEKILNSHPLGYETEKLYSLLDLLSVVDKYFNDFESQTCENCRFSEVYKDRLLICNNDYYDGCIFDTQDNLIIDALFYPDNDFGCNKFISKEKDKK